MSETYSYKDKFPLGLNTAYRMLHSQFSYAPIKINSLSFEKKFPDLNVYDSGVVYILITNRLYLSENEANYMLNFAAKGNTLFISAAYIDTALTKNLEIRSIDNSWRNFLIQDDYANLLRDDTVKVSHPYTGEYEPYSFFYKKMDQYFSISDSSKAGAFGKNTFDSSNYTGIKYGKGHIWIHSNPLLFSNYFLLTKNNYEYFEKVFSYLNDKPVIVFWDDYYRTARYGSNFSSLQVFFKYPSLTWALLLGIGLLLLYVAFVSKRKQRIIPALQPNINSSVSFVQTVGLLYLQKKDNRNIAVKMITYFLEYVRNHYFIATNIMNADFVKSLSRKSSISEERINELLRIMESVDERDNISDIELLDLHNRILEFYKNKDYGK
ncbi:MAG: hypothetical protein HYX40_10185 [Sphingobacteriales bacterium]|nr:hypothetical protein [Sphingobacteriales bacterium]